MKIGVKVTTTSQAGRSNSGTTSGRWFVAGLTERGPANTPTVIRSIAGFEATFGGRTPYNSPFYDALRSFWEEGGAEAVIVRVVGADATSGSLDLADAETNSVMTLRASSPGAWSEQVQVAVSDTTGLSGTRSKIVVATPWGSEVFTQATAGELVSAINARSQFLTAELTGAPDSKPAAVDAKPLGAGDDKRSTIDGAAIVKAFEKFGADWGTGSVSAPGYPADIVGEGLLIHAAQMNRVALLAGESGATEADMLELAQSLSGGDFGEFGTLIYPHITVPDGTTARTAPPEGFAAAKRAVGHAQIGPWHAPAGDFSTATWVMGTESVVDTTMNERLADGRVTGITTAGSKTRLYGWWSLSEDAENFRLLTARDMLNYLADAAAKVLEPYVFSVIDGRGLLTGQVESSLIGVLDPIARAGGFFPLHDDEGNEIDPGYRVIVDDTINTTDTVQENKVVAKVSVRLAPTATLIELEIVKVPFTAGL